MTCRIPGCERKAKSRGWCHKHYERWRRHGDPLAGRTPEGEPLAFLNGLPDTLECIMWPYATAGLYGIVWVDQEWLGAHVMSCRLAHGPMPSDKRCAAHSCDTPMCVNPKHLRWATYSENEADKRRKVGSGRG